jgi:hypothetical protein
MQFQAEGNESMLHKRSLSFRETLTVVVMNSCVFWEITPCSPLKVNRRFEYAFLLHLQGRISRDMHDILPGLFHDPEDVCPKVGRLSTDCRRCYSSFYKYQLPNHWARFTRISYWASTFWGRSWASGVLHCLILGERYFSEKVSSFFDAEDYVTWIRRNTQ